MMRNVQLANNIARVIAAAYIAALIAGPWPFGWAILSPEDCPRAIIVSTGLAVLIIPWMFAGFIAGPRWFAGAVAIGYLFWQSRWFVGVLFRGEHWGILMWVIIFLPIAMCSAWIGSRLSSRLAGGKSLQQWRLWRTAAVIALLLAVYTSAIGPTVALHAMKAKFKPADTGKIIAYPAGAYLGVDGITRCTCGFPDTYYTDPSGLIFLYKVNLD